MLACAPNLRSIPPSGQEEKVTREATGSSHYGYLLTIRAITLTKNQLTLTKPGHQSLTIVIIRLTIVEITLTMIIHRADCN